MNTSSSKLSCIAATFQHLTYPNWEVTEVFQIIITLFCGVKLIGSKPHNSLGVKSTEAMGYFVKLDAKYGLKLRMLVCF